MTAVPKPTPRVKAPKTLKQSVHRIPDHARRATLELWGDTCLWCQQAGGALDLHHVQRRSQGGQDERTNLRPVHRKCHMYIHDHPTEAKRMGFLT